MICEKCGTILIYYDRTSRIVRKKNRHTTLLYIPRYRCKTCNIVRRIIPENLYSYKQYDSEIIKGVIYGYITPDTIGYEDYPCESTMIRWKKEASKIMNTDFDYIQK